MIFANHDRQLETLRSHMSSVGPHTAALRTHFDRIMHSVEVLRRDLEELKSKQKTQIHVLGARIETLENGGRRFVSGAGDQIKSEPPVPDLLPAITPRVAICDQTLLQPHGASVISPGARPRSVSPVPTPICSRAPSALVLHPSKPDSYVECPLKGDKALHGIISYLTRKYGGNVHNTRIVTITSRSQFDDPRSSVVHVADLTTRSRFVSKDQPDQWVCWDFGKMRIIPTHYSIRTGWGGHHLRSWIVESSMDAQAWIVIDRRAHTTELDQTNAIATILLTSPIECRYVRLTQTDTNSSMKNYLKIAGFEPFGSLIE